MIEVVQNTKDAIEAFQQGKVVVFLTDTVVGLGVAVAYAKNPTAIFDVKKRKSGKPVAWLVGGVDALDVYGCHVPDYARNLAHAFWPGALTLVVKASEAVPAAFQSKEGAVGLRMPAHSSTLEIIQQVGPLAASSANLSGEEAPASLDVVSPKIIEAVACVCSDGSTPSGVASTVVDCTGQTPVVLRQGSVVF